MGDIERPDILSEDDREEIRAVVAALPPLTPAQLDALCETLTAIRAGASS